MLSNFFRGKRVFITGHTGFKGSWLCLWLYRLGAEITGYALEPPTSPSLFNICGLTELVTSTKGDVRNLDALTGAMIKAQPEIVVHMAAQPLVRDSYRSPVETYEINVNGTINLLEAVRHTDSVRVVINVTTDKVYENKEWVWGYRENEPLGGYDPYSSSKACADLVTSAYRNSFFNSENYRQHGVALASVRAGNVIGGGDWAADRLIPDCFRALLSKQPILVRNPKAIRPWQHVLEPLYGYLLLASKLYSDGNRFSQAWNFGPPETDAKAVEWIVQKICELWGQEARYQFEIGDQLHEAQSLKLDCSKARKELKWLPRWPLETALEKITKWNQYYHAGEVMADVCMEQIDEYVKTEEGE